MKKNNNWGKKTNIEIVVYFWIVMWGINLFGLGTRIVFFGGILLILYMDLKNKKLPQSYFVTLIQVISFGLVYSLFLNYYGEYNFFRGYREFLLPPLLFAIGFRIIYEVTDIEESYKRFQNIIVLLAISLFLYSSVNLAVHLIKFGEITYYERYVYDIWTSSRTAATTQGSRFILISAMLPIGAFVKREMKIKTRVIVIIFAVISIIETLIMSNRTLLIILFINIVLCAFMYLLWNKSNGKVYLRFLFAMTIIIVFGLFLYTQNVFNIRNLYENSNFYLRMQLLDKNISHNARFDAWEKTIVGLADFPFGGSRANIDLSAPHNLWLDVAYVTGIVPFTMLIFITIKYIHSIIVVFRLTYQHRGFKLFVFSISISVLLNCMVEPILGGHYILFMIFILQFGLIQGLINKMNRISNSS